MGGRETLIEGDRVGEFVVAENRGGVLRLRQPQRVPLAALAVAAAAVVALGVREAGPLGRGAVAEALFGRSLFLVVIAAIAVFVSLPYLRLAYEADGGARTLTRRRAFGSRTWSFSAEGEGGGAVGLAVRHQGPNEVLVLLVQPDVPPSAAGGRAAQPIVLAATRSDNERSRNLVTAAARLSTLLGVPVLRSGTSRAAGVEAALDTTRAELVDDGDGRDLLINCPRCGGRSVGAVAYDQVEQYYLVLRHRTTWVRCGACGATLYSKAEADALRGRSPAELEAVVVWRVSLVARVSAVLAAVLCWFPIAGLFVSVLAAMVNWRNRGWLRTVSLAALAVSTASTAATVLLTGR